MPPRAIASPKRKRSKRKGSDALKTGLPKKSRAADIAEVPSMVPLVSLGLAGAEAANDAPRRSGCPNAGTGGCPLVPMFQSIPKPQSHSRKGRKKDSKAVPPPYSSLVSDAPDASAMDIAEPSLTLLQPGRRCQENPYVAVGMKVAEQRARDAIAEQRARDAIAEQRARDAINEQRARDAIDEKRVRDAIAEKQARDAITEQRAQHTQRSVFLEHNLDPALRQEDDTDPRRTATPKAAAATTAMTVTTATTKIPTERLMERMMKRGRTDDTVKSSQEFGWGEAGRRQKEHPGFSKDALPSQPPVARPLTPEFEFQYSCDEDDSSRRPTHFILFVQWNESSQGPQDISPGLQRQQSQHIETITSKPEDVLQRHHEKNRKPRLPDPDSLKLLNQETESSVQPSRAKRSKASGSGPTPDQLSWYGPRWKRFLEDAKAECRLQHALENPFPALVKNLPGSITEVLIATLVMWDRNGEQFEAGVWPEQKINMSRLSVLKLYDDLSTWRSDLKKTAISIAPLSYSLIPPLSVPTQERAAWIEHAAAGLIKESLFLRFGVDEMCLALVAAVFNCVLDGLAKNGHGKSYPNFSSKDYSPIYNRMLVFLKDILGDAYHGPRLAAALNLEGVVEAKHDHLQILLD
ncbi:hypothetical protein EDD22DRAFT_852522 [Suillus occidentalis]|nr:hypothetical protein EDD22DRAFT_852522 [Suillus occidentalis]